ncbi:MAG: hypothetical protein ACJ8R9_23240 [Steroidobacteraceae bacterium]
MSFNININTLAKGVELAATIESGGTLPTALSAGRQALALTASNSFDKSLTQLGITGDTRDTAVNVFGSSFSDASGIQLSDSPATQAVLDASFRNGNLAPASQDVTDSMTRLTIALGIKGQQHDSGGGGDAESWLEAIARAMGKALGTMAQNLVTESNQLSSLSGNSSGSGAQQFQTVMAKFQAHSQLFGMLSDAFSNAIKSIGQGMQTMGSKT